MSEAEFQELIEKFDEYIERRYRERIPLDNKVITSLRTVKSYKALIRWLLKLPIVWEYPMTRETVIRVISELRSYGMSYSTCLMIYSVFRNLFEAMGWKWDLIWSMLGLKEEAKEAPYLDLKEMETVIANALKSSELNIRDKAILALVSLGIRPHDVASLTIGNISFLKDGSVAVTYTPCKRGVPGTTRILKDNKAEVLKNWIEYLRIIFNTDVKQAPCREEIGIPDDLPLFPKRSVGRYGRHIFKGYPKKKPKPINSLAIWKVVHNACKLYLPSMPKRIQIVKKIAGEGTRTPYSPYGFRRGYVTERLNNKDPKIAMKPWELQKLMGWKHINTVLRYDKTRRWEIALEEAERPLY